MTKVGKFIRIFIFSAVFALPFGAYNGAMAQTSMNSSSQTSYSQGNTSSGATNSTGHSAAEPAATTRRTRRMPNYRARMVVTSPKGKNVTRKALKLRRINGGSLMPFSAKRQNNIFKSKNFNRPKPYFSNSTLSSKSTFKK